MPPSLTALVFAGIGSHRVRSITSSENARVWSLRDATAHSIASYPTPTMADPHQRFLPDPLRPAVTLYKVNFPHPQLMIYLPYDICETPRSPSHTFAPLNPLHPYSHSATSTDLRIRHKLTAWLGLSPLFKTRRGTAVSWPQRVPWILISQTCGVFLILVHPFFNLI